MKIAIDLTALYNRKVTGLENYGIELYKALLDTNATIYPIFRCENTLDDNPNAYIIKSSSRLLVENLLLSKVLRKMDIDVALFPIFPPPLDIYFLNKCLVIPTIHDLAFLKFSSTLSLSARIYLKPKYLCALYFSSKIITISETIKREINLISRIPTINWGENISKDFININKRVNIDFLLKRTILPFNYFLSVSTIEPRKNLKYLITIFKEYKVNHPDIKLVLVGRKGWGIDEITNKLIEEVRCSIIFTDFVSIEELATLYYYSKAFILLSLYEGFGRTPLEALACGCKVIVSDIPIFKETLGDNAYYLPLNDVTKSVSLLQKYNFSLKSDFNLQSFFTALDENVINRYLLDLK